MTREKIYVGIDPGKNGGLVAIDKNGNIIRHMIMPLITKEELDPIGLIEFVTFEEHDVKIALENVHSIHMSSAKSNFQFGRIVGAIEAALKVSQMPYMLVDPKKWQKTSFEGIPALDNPKDRALLASVRLFPTISFVMSSRSKNPHDGVIDAALIAYWAKVSNL